jgi:hypothetical protein
MAITSISERASQVNIWDAAATANRNMRASTKKVTNMRLRIRKPPIQEYSAVFFEAPRLGRDVAT